MNKLNILRRHLTVLRLVQPPFTYPSKAKILHRLEQEDLESVSPRTFERDVKEIECSYGIRIAHCPRRRGYFLHQPEDEDLSNFRQFFQLLERSERLAFLTNSSDALRSSKYLLLEESQSLSGLQHLPVLWNALRLQQEVTFGYQTFKTPLPKPYQVDPLVLLEYRNRWYLAAWDAADQRFKTFGLERMQAPALTQLPVQTDRRAAFLALKQDALGVTIGPEHEVAQVVIRVDTAMAPYIRTVPLHHSQIVTAEDKAGMTVCLHIIINHELESAILGFGEHVEVLEPVELRERIRGRVRHLLDRYQNKETKNNALRKNVAERFPK
ncbi:WYL domain-containing protein [Pontibacter sp. E15-1]|uniref:helix-turn-helix transcriptional regulator n=1 Tax=Pontibacter sp. E15-1 TaxID=2919918 RepID=UPI001F4F8939|nr:WYL domain-containing protein [Pontibacter sp. E15-1]MCJ8165889.1 WYL domain-containing protein [Pontibacter sp. E15-1]